MTRAARLVREQAFWDHRVPSLEECLRQVEAGPEANTLRVLDLLSPLDGLAVLDVGCGTGAFSAWLAARGARVTGIDISAEVVARAGELHRSLGFDSCFVAAPLSAAALEGRVFDRLAGRYVLHHLDPPSIANDLASLLRPGGAAAFVETVGLSPLLRFARAHLTGRFGIPRYGTADERPLTWPDLVALERAFGALHLEVAEMQFFRILDRQIFGYRSRFASQLLGAFDELLLRAGGRTWSYHQVVFLTKAAAATGDTVR